MRVTSSTTATLENLHIPGGLKVQLNKDGVVVLGAKFEHDSDGHLIGDDEDTGREGG